jgi:uncharacterized repeat protein (TIGR01451 family)
MTSTGPVHRNARPGAGRRRLVAAAAGALTLAAAGTASAALNGPVILGGDNFPEHGGFSGAPTGGWIAMERSLAWVAPRVGRFNDGSVAAIGAQGPSLAITDDAGAAIGRAAGANGMTVRYVEGPAAIAAFFAQIRSGDAIPRVIWIAGNQSANAVDSLEEDAINANRDAIAGFVATGGGLIAHGDENLYGTPASPGWLAALVPGLEAYSPGAFGLALTPAGAAALPGLTDPDINAGPWRNAFRGDLGGLQVLAQATTQFEDPGDTVPKKVLLGGGTAHTATLPADVALTMRGPTAVDRGDTFAYRLTVTNRGPGVAGGVRVLDTLPAGFAFRGASTPGGTCAGGQTTTCQLGAIAVGRSETVTILAKSLRRGLRTNNAVVRTATTDPVASGNARRMATRTLTTGLDVTVAAPDVAVANGIATVRISVRNTGRRAAKGVVLRSPTPAGFSLLRRPAGARVEGRVAIWEMGNLAPGRTRVTVFRLLVGATTRGRHCVAGIARARNADPDGARDCLVAIRG